MRINSLTVSYTDIGRLLTAIEKCGVTVPKTLSDVLSAHEKLTAASSIPDPVKALVAAALDGRATPDKVDKLLEQTAVARLGVEERKWLHQRVEPELLKEFGRRLEDTGADQVLDLLRPQFTSAAGTLQSALSTTGGLPDDPQAFLESAGPEELLVLQSMRPAVETLDRVGMIAAAFGPLGAFPVVADPRSVDPAIRCGWLHSTAVMCADSDLLQSCAEFQKPSPLGDLATSAWLRCRPYLHTVASATERLRAWAESAWAAEEAQRRTSGRLINGVVVPDEPRRNPFTHDEVTAS